MCTWKSYLKTWMRNQFPSVWSPFVSSNMFLCLSVCRNEMLIVPSRRFRTAYIRNDAVLSSLGMGKLTTPSRRPPLQETPTYGHIHWDPQWWLPNTPQKQPTPSISWAPLDSNLGSQPCTWNQKWHWVCSRQFCFGFDLGFHIVIYLFGCIVIIFYTTSML